MSTPRTSPNKMRKAKRKIVPGISGVKLGKHTLMALEKKNKKAFRILDKFVKAHNKNYAKTEDQKYRILASFKTTAKCILQGFIVAAENNCLHGKYFETSTALIAQYVDATPRTIKRHIHRLKDAGIIVDQQHNLSFTFNNNYLIRLADWLIEELYQIVEEVNRTAQVQQEVAEQTTTGTEQIKNPIEPAIERGAQKLVSNVENYKDKEVYDTRKSWQQYLKSRLFGSG